MACAPSKDSDQSGHSPSLIRVFTVCMKKAWVLSYPLSAQWRLWSNLVGCPGWSESSLGAHAILLVLSWGGSSCFHHQIQCLSLYNSLDVFSLTFSLALFVFLYIWATTWQNQQNECAPSEDSDQPGHPPSLIRVFTVLMKKPWVLSYPLSTQRRLRSQADLSLCWAHTHFVGFVMLWHI